MFTIVSFVIIIRIDIVIRFVLISTIIIIIRLFSWNHDCYTVGKIVYLLYLISLDLG